MYRYMLMLIIRILGQKIFMQPDPGMYSNPTLEGNLT